MALRTHVRTEEQGTKVWPKGKKRGFGRLVISAQGVVHRLDILPDTGSKLSQKKIKSRSL